MLPARILFSEVNCGFTVLANPQRLRFHPAMQQPRNHALPSLMALVCFLASHEARADWPQFRGPGASGVNTTKPLPTHWDVASGTNIAWQTPLPGLSHASPITSGDRIFIATSVGPNDSQLKVGLYGSIDPVEESDPQTWRLLSVDAKTGRILWNIALNAAVPKVKRHPKATHCNSTPATDGTNIVAIFSSEGLFCVNAKDGKLRWRKSLGPMDSGYFESPSSQWGFASSPVIHAGKVIVQCDVQTNSFLAAFDIRDGRELWRTPRADVPGWSTPAIIEAAGRKQIALNGWHHSGGYDFTTGKELWRLKGGGDIPVPTPILANDLIYLTSGHGKLRPMRAIRTDTNGDITAATPEGTNNGIAWVHPRQGNYMQTPIAVGGKIFACTDWGVLTCFDGKTGKIHFSERISDGKQGFTASPVSDGRHLYFPSETGNVIVMPVSETFSTLATNSMRDVCMASPAIHDGKLLFRTQTKLIAVGRN
jgi:outer membrane protein assembly factor BamB